MSALTDFDLDDSGKVDLHRIYDQPDPRDYYQTLGNLDYRIPAAAEPIFRAVIAAERTFRKVPDLTALDVGCSYGVNAAILKHGCALADLFAFYGPSVVARLPRAELIARDRGFFKNCVSDDDLTVIGLDAAARPVDYAVQTHVMDAGVVADLEARAPDDEEAAHLADVDLVISTGAIGYVGAPTFTHILDHARKAPWFALFALAHVSDRRDRRDAHRPRLRRVSPDGAAIPPAALREPRRSHRRARQSRRPSGSIQLGARPTAGTTRSSTFARPAEDDGPLPIAGLRRI